MHLRATLLAPLAILFLAPPGSASAQHRQERFPSAHPYSPVFTAPAPAPGTDARAATLSSDDGEVFYTPTRLVLSTLGILCGPLGGLAALELGLGGPWDQVADIGAAVGVTTCVTAGLLIPGPTPTSAVTPTLVGAASGFAAGVVLGGFGVLLGAVGAHVGFAWAAFSDRSER